MSEPPHAADTTGSALDATLDALKAEVRAQQEQWKAAAKKREHAQEVDRACKVRACPRLAAPIHTA